MQPSTIQPQTSEPRLGRSVSLDQAARLLNVSRRTIYNRISDGRLATIRTPGGSQRVLLESLSDLASHLRLPVIQPAATFAAVQVISTTSPSR